MITRPTKPIVATRRKTNRSDEIARTRPAYTRRTSLQKAILELFLPRFGHGAKLVYAGLAGDQCRYHDPEISDRLGLAFDSSNEPKGIIAHLESRNWLYLIDAPLSRDLASDAQHNALAQIAKNSGCGLVFVSVFASINSFKRHIGRINWGTTVWLASEPDHSIHWNGGHHLEARY